MQLKKIAAALATGILVSASAASAATVDFNVNKSWTSGDLSYTGSDGTGVTANGKTYDGDFALGGDILSNVYAASWSGDNGGIGVCSGSVSSYCSESHQVDGNGGVNEGVLFTFDTMVQILSITFAYADDNDEFDFDVKLGASAGPGIDYYDIPLFGGSCVNMGGTQDVCTVSALTTIIGTQFLVGAFYDTSNFKIKSMEYMQAPAVPLPAAGWMMIAGLGGLAALRRKKAA